MINPRELIIKELREHILNCAYEPLDIWDILRAQHGLTVIMRDGKAIPLRINEGAAKQILHSFSTEA